MTKPEKISQSAFTPPAVSDLQFESKQYDKKLPKPLIPAIIGIFTYGSSSPYAFVLCIEQYLSLSRSAIPWTTHFAMVLSALGTVGWIGINAVFVGEIFTSLTGRGTSSYAVIGYTIWGASAIFLIWMIWRIQIFQRELAPLRQNSPGD